MKCINCYTTMICNNDVNDISIRIDWYYCPNCNSTSEIHYGNNGEYITKVIWEKSK